MKRLILTTIATFSLCSAFAQDGYPGTIVTDRPDQTEASSTVYPGALQIESGITWQTFDLARSSSDQTRRIESFALPNTHFRLGLVENFELRVVTQPELLRSYVAGEEISRTAGLADLQLGFKWRIYSGENGGPEVGFLSHLVVPTGSDGLSIESYGVINKLAVTHSLSDKHSLAWNLGYDYLGEGNGDLFYSLAWGIGLSEKVGVYLEPYGFLVNLEEMVFNADAGLTYLLSDNMQFDYSFGLGLNEEMNYHSIGFSIRLPH